ncbi:MAG: hypothetical protein CBC13_04780 [Planctomycetia bacterium TMED53]|nr:MAG: hypothetical protein CBC13_04780 [Planctomycetia bacterium TMED53]
MKCLITGAGGFIGGRLAQRLIEMGHEIVTFQRGEYPHLNDLGGTHYRGSLDHFDQLMAAFSDVDAVFHVAALAAISGPKEDFERTNVIGTQNVIDACRKNGIERLIFTSSPSVVFSGGDQNGIDESEPYPDHFLADYPRTKALAEGAVLSANDEQLKTIALRPHLVWGPGDRHLFPRIIDRARNNKLKLVRRPGMKIDACYIDNAIDAHICALEKLDSNPACRGKAYFISNGEPIAPEDLIQQFLECEGLPLIRPTLPPAVARFAGWLIESLYKTPFFNGEPPVTRFVVRQQSTSHWFDLSAAKRDLDWVPKVSTEEGMKHLRSSLRESESVST